MAVTMPTRPQAYLMTTTLDIGPAGTAASGSPEWRALALLNAANAFAEAACGQSCVCIPLRQKLKLEEAAAFYMDLALEQVAAAQQEHRERLKGQ
jgi:hypothetical protein